MKKAFLLLAFLTIMSCKKHNSTLENNNNEIITEEKVKKDCNQYSAESAVLSYLLKTRIIEYNGQAKCKAIKINDDCDYRVTVTFYLENLYSGDGTRDYMVSFDGNEYFVH